MGTNALGMQAGLATHQRRAPGHWGGAAGWPLLAMHTARATLQPLHQNNIVCPPPQKKINKNKIKTSTDTATSRQHWAMRYGSTRPDGGKKSFNEGVDRQNAQPRTDTGRQTHAHTYPHNTHTTTARVSHRVPAERMLQPPVLDIKRLRPTDSRGRVLRDYSAFPTTLFCVPCSLRLRSCCTLHSSLLSAIRPLMLSIWAHCHAGLPSACVI